MEIKTTKDYEKFDTILGNRVINEKKVERLMDDINKGLNLLPYCPIIVYPENGKLKIVDGQHRFETSVRLEEPVFYVECEPLNLKQIARLNSRSDKWGSKDFLDCYVRLGVEDYKILKEFMKTYETIYTVSIDLLMFYKIASGQGGMDKFRDGEFKVNYFEESSQLIELTRKLFDRYKFWNDRNLIMAVQKLQDKGLCDFEVLKRKISEAPNEMDKQASPKLYIYNIERVYNFKNSIRTVIF
jgi:hypothetical protein|tara:strand:- start:264 stop:989 length:726 start_codon:yes stop_codon:yes gene_type:complete